MSGETVERREGLVSGALVFRGTRVPVAVLFEYLEDAREGMGATATTD